MSSQPAYSVPREARRLFEDEILKNPLLKHLPPELSSLSKHIRFEGSPEPNVPINWRFAESISALKALEASMLNHLITRRYGVDPVEIKINTDHATLFIMSPMVAQFLNDGALAPANPLSTEIQKLFPNEDKHRAQDGYLRSMATNLYKTKDERYYHVHGSMNPDPTLTALGLHLEPKEDDTFESALEALSSAVSQVNSADLDERMNEEYKQAGTIAWTSEEYLSSEHGQKNSGVGLYEISMDARSSQPASWWPESSGSPTSAKRPLAGLKVVDLTRVIAGPAITRSLAEVGASVMRVTSPHVTDLSAVHQDLNWGKWNCRLHLKDEADREKLRQLILEADVVVDGYRPGVMDRLGFGRQAIFDMVKGRSRGIVHLRENCYGWHGPWSHRSGWQQISDACCGVSISYGRAMGLDEAVTPVFPNSDYCTGVCGSIAVLDAIVQRAEKGGSYGVDVALNYYSQWLVRSCGTYNNDVWTRLWTRHGSPVFRHYHNMPYLLPSMMKILYQNGFDALFQRSFFGLRKSENLGVTFLTVDPVLQFPGGEVKLGYKAGDSWEWGGSASLAQGLRC